ADGERRDAVGDDERRGAFHVGDDHNRRRVQRRDRIGHLREGAGPFDQRDAVLDLRRHRAGVGVGAPVPEHTNGRERAGGNRTAAGDREQVHRLPPARLRQIGVRGRARFRRWTGQKRCAGFAENLVGGEHVARGKRTRIQTRGGGNGQRGGRGRTKRARTGAIV